MVDYNLKGKVALITGGSRGIGRAISTALADEGAECILTSRKLADLDEAVQDIRSRGASARAMSCNNGSMDEIGNLFAEIASEYDHLDIVINNAATNPYFGEMVNAEEWAWEKTMAVNLKAPFFIIQKSVSLMEAGGGGAIVNIASIDGVRPHPFQGIYSITKGGLITMTQAYAKELAHKNIRVNALLPGLIKTRFSQVLFENEEVYNEAVKNIPMGRHGEPSELVGALLYLVSDASSFTTGTTLVCDGGMIA